MSPPAENAEPDPVSTIARASRSGGEQAEQLPQVVVQLFVHGVEIGVGMVDRRREQVPGALQPDGLHPPDRTSPSPPNSFAGDFR